MIKRACPPPPVDDAWWVDWSARAAAAARQLLVDAAAGRVITNQDIEPALYKEPRKRIFDSFHGKCAYCETSFVVDQTGDVEHFRPKCGVTDLANRPVRDHPGYYWLAYTWENLLPSCAKCNRYENQRGKGNRFPVAGDAYATTPEHLAAELRLLIHPVLDEPDDHLFFLPDTGLLGFKTRNGDVTIQVFGLNREGLFEERRLAYDEMNSRIGELFEALRQRNAAKAGRALQRIRDYSDGRAQYAMAGRVAFSENEQDLRPLFAMFQA